MSGLFISILNMSIKASYIIVFIMLLRLGLKKAPKIISYVLWSLVGFRLIIPISFESIFSLIPQKISSGLIPQDIIYQESPQINSGIATLDSFVNKSLPSLSLGASVNPLQVYAEIGAYIWIIGMFILLIYGLVSVLLLKKQLKSAQLIDDNIFQAENLQTPFVLGFLQAKIYLPAGLKEEEKAYIVLHEKSHIHRKDHLVKIFGFLLLSLHWFNPLVWLSFILMSRDMELSCDERVLREVNKDIKKEYAHSLLSLASGRHILNPSPLAFGQGDVKGRIKNVMNYKKPKILVVMVSILALVLASIALLSNPNQVDGEVALFTPGEDKEIVLKPSQVIYINEAPSLYSLGDVGLEFSLTEDKLLVKGQEETKVYDISYDKTSMTLDEFQNKVPRKEEFPDISYKNIVRYDLCKSTKDSPGYSLYVLNGETYWMATLYNNDIWRLISMNESYYRASSSEDY